MSLRGIQHAIKISEESCIDKDIHAHDMDDNKLEMLEKRLENIENILTHLHGHLEHVLEKIEFHDRRLTELSCLLLDEYTEMEIDKVLNPCIDISYTKECYTPINEKDDDAHKKRLQAIRDSQGPLYLEKIE